MLLPGNEYEHFPTSFLHLLAVFDILVIHCIINQEIKSLFLLLYPQHMYTHIFPLFSSKDPVEESS